MITVFHGSNHIIKKPQYMGGKPDNDYGNGFYTTEYEDRAQAWAVLNGNPDQSIINIYTLAIEELKVLELNECGITAQYAIKNILTYQAESGGYLDASISVLLRLNLGCNRLRGRLLDDYSFSLL